MSDPSQEELEALAAKCRAAMGRAVGMSWLADDFDAPMELVDARAGGRSSRPVRDSNASGPHPDGPEVAL